MSRPFRLYDYMRRALRKSLARQILYQVLMRFYKEEIVQTLRHRRNSHSNKDETDTVIHMDFEGRK